MYFYQKYTNIEIFTPRHTYHKSGRSCKTKKTESSTFVATLNGITSHKKWSDQSSWIFIFTGSCGIWISLRRKEKIYHPKHLTLYSLPLKLSLVRNSYLGVWIVYANVYMKKKNRRRIKDKTITYSLLHKNVLTLFPSLEPL